MARAPSVKTILEQDDKRRLRDDSEAMSLLRQRFTQFSAARSAAEQTFPQAYVASTGFRMFGGAGSLLGGMWR